MSKQELGPWPFPTGPKPVGKCKEVHLPKAAPKTVLAKGVSWDFPSEERLKPVDPFPFPLVETFNRPVTNPCAEETALMDLLQEAKPQIERDPNGRRQNEAGAKVDAGKDRVWLCLAGFSNALREVAKVTTVGANKYTPNGWKDVPNGYERYMDAFGRHLLDFGAGGVVDNGPGGTNCLHLAQMIWNLLAALELDLTKKNGND